MRTSFFRHVLLLLALVLWSHSALAQCDEERNEYYASINKALKLGIDDYKDTLAERRLENDAARILALSLRDATGELPTAQQDLKDAEENGGYGETAAAKYRLCQLKRRIATLSRPGSSIGTKFGALAIDQDHGTSFGWAIDSPSGDAAADRALAECRNRASRECSLVMQFNDTCATYAVDASRSSTAYGWGSGGDKAAADNRALSECSRRGGPGGKCAIRVWGCTSK